MTDIITALDGSPVSDMQEYSTYLQSYENGLEISMQISRYSGDGELEEAVYRLRTKCSVGGLCGIQSDLSGRR